MSILPAISDAAPPCLGQLERSLSAAGFETRNNVWEVLQGGRTNRSWRVESDRGPLVCKLYSEENSNPLFPNDPASEALALRHLRGADFAPQLVLETRTPAGQYIVYRHAPGRALGRVMENDKAHDMAPALARLSQLLTRLHRTPAPAGVREISGGNVGLREQTRRILAMCRSGLAEILRELEPTSQPVEPVPTSFLHGDVVSENIIAHNGKLTLIDWQCPAIGDPCEDLSTFLSPAMHHVYSGRLLTEDEATEFLDYYGVPGIADRLTRLRPLFHWRMAAYCLWRAEQGEPDYKQGFSLEVQALKGL